MHWQTVPFSPRVECRGTRPSALELIDLEAWVEMFKVANTLYVSEGIDVQKLPLNIFQQQSAVLGKVKLN